MAASSASDADGSSPGASTEAARPNPFAEVDEVVHRDSSSPVRGRRPFRVVVGRPDVAFFDTYPDALEQKGRVAEQLSQTDSS